MLELKEALKKVIEAECDVCHKGRHLYQSMGSGEYVILRFDDRKSDVIDESPFISLDDAIEVFMKETGLCKQIS